MADTIMLSVDRSKVFDAIAAMDGNYGPLGERLVGIMLGDTAAISRVGLLGVYGIELLDPPEPARRPFALDRRAQAAVLADLPESVAQEAGEFYENFRHPHQRHIRKSAAMAHAWEEVLRPYLIGLRDQYAEQARPADAELSDAK